MLRITLTLFAIVATVPSALASPCDDYQTPYQVLAGLKSTDAVTRLVARDCGVNSESHAMRGVVLQNIIGGIAIMSFDVSVAQGDAEGAKQLDRIPALGATGIKWSDDGRTFEGPGNSGSSTKVSGHLLGESLGVNFYQVFIRPEKPGTNQNPTDCSATLALPKGGGQLTGTLRCGGIPARFVITMGM